MAAPIHDQSAADRFPDEPPHKVNDDSTGREARLAGSAGSEPPVRANHSNER